MYYCTLLKRFLGITRHVNLVTRGNPPIPQSYKGFTTAPMLFVSRKLKLHSWGENKFFSLNLGDLNHYRTWWEINVPFWVKKLYLLDHNVLSNTMWMLQVCMIALTKFCSLAKQYSISASTEYYKIDKRHNILRCESSKLITIKLTKVTTFWEVKVWNMDFKTRCCPLFNIKITTTEIKKLLDNWYKMEQCMFPSFYCFDINAHGSVFVGHDNVSTLGWRLVFRGEKPRGVNCPWTW